MSPPRPAPRLLSLLLLVLGLGLVAAACGGSDDEGVADGTADEGAAPVTEGESTTSSPADPATTATTAPSGTETADADADTDEDTDADADSDFADLVWTVVAVDWDDVLNVRASPSTGADVVGTLEPWSQAFTGTTTTEEVGGALWRRVELDDGVEGWVNARYLVAQPATLGAAEQSTLIEATTNLVYWALGTGDGHDPAPLLADRALWVGGIGVYADLPQWNWVPADEADSIEDWTATRTFELSEEAGDVECGDLCDQTLVEFTGFDTLGATWTVSVDDHVDGDRNGFTDGVFHEAPEGLHRTVVDKPASEGTDEDGNPMIELDWQRIHVVHDWSADPTGEPRLLIVHTWGWTP